VARAGGEWALLARLLPRINRGLSRRVRVPPGDDAAVVEAGGRSWAVTTDMLVEGVHFRRRWTSGEDLGHKLLAVNLSDLAAMGDAGPAFGVVSLGITGKTPVDFVDGFLRGLQGLARRHAFDLVGGDTVRAERVTANLTVMAELKSRPVRRSGAREGDRLLVTGTLGDAAAGLACLERKRGRPEAHLVKRLLRPEPRLEPARRLMRIGPPSAMIDCSDGLWRSVRLLADASGAGVRVETERLPLSAPLRRWAARTGRDPLDYALAGGEDYELVLTAPPAAAARIVRAGLASDAGRVTARREGVTATFFGRKRRIPRGFEHFGGD
jgi:thiamine-monophosphate kinase